MAEAEVVVGEGREDGEDGEDGDGVGEEVVVGDWDDQTSW
jgi:hypothetical protein